MTDESEDISEGEGEGESKEEDLIGKYIGDRNVNGERHGKGWAILPNGDQYDGDYRKGQRHGIGLYVFRNGARYLGRYRCGSKSGQGVFYYPDGGIYQGAWRRDMKHGYGVYTYPNGDVYKGNWYKNRRHGVGLYIYKVDGVCFTATWKKGVRVGPIEINYGRHKYHGYWDYLYPQGPGMFTFDCKYMLSGYYQSDISVGFAPPFGEEGEEEEEPMSKLDDLNEMEGLEGLEEEEGEDIWAIKQKIPPSIWYAQEMYHYDFSKLPQHPVPLPIPDSEESICDLSAEEEEKEDRYKGEEEMEIEKEESVELGPEEEPIELPVPDIWSKCPP